MGRYCTCHETEAAHHADRVIELAEAKMRIGELEAKLRRAATDLAEKKLCPFCGKKMKMQVDSITGKKNKYEWGCKCYPKMRISIG